MFSAHWRAGKPSPFSKRASQSSGSSAPTTRKAASSSRTTSLPSAWCHCSPTRLQPDLDLATLYDHLMGAEGDLREGEAPPSGDMVLEAVPGAGDDLAVVDPFELPGVLLSGDEGAQRRFAPTQRPRLVRADVGLPKVLTPDVEHTD